MRGRGTVKLPARLADPISCLQPPAELFILLFTLGS